MEMREIEAFLAVADERHFGRAARRLQVSTSHVSQTVRVLERRVGGPLFVRTSRSVTLTPVGEQLLGELRPAYGRIVSALKEARRATRPLDRSPLRLALSTSVSSVIREDLVTRFATAHPACTVIRYDLPAADLIAGLISGVLPADVHVLHCPPVRDTDFSPDVVLGPVLAREERALATAPTHPLAGRGSVDVEELADHALRTPAGFPSALVDGWVPPRTPGGRLLNRIGDGDTTFVEELPAVLADGLLVHLTVASMALNPPPGLVVTPLTGLPPMPCISAWRAGDDNPWIARFVQVASAEA